MPIAQLNQLFHTPGRVVESKGLHSWVVGQETPALRESNRVRKDAIDRSQRRAGDRDEIVLDAEQRLADNRDLVIEQEVEMLGDGSCEAVFNGNCGSVYGAIGHGR